MHGGHDLRCEEHAHQAKYARGHTGFPDFLPRELPMACASRSWSVLLAKHNAASPGASF
jgi:hypothetical protein